MKKDKFVPTRRADWRSVTTIALAVPVLVVLFMLLYFRPVEKAPNSQIAIIATGEYPPFSGEKLQEKGIASAIVSLVMKEIGYESNLQFMPWPLVNTSTKESSTNRGVRAAFPYAKTAEREKVFYFSDPIVEVETSIFYNKSKTPDITSETTLSQLSDYRLLPIEGYRYLPAVENLPKLKSSAENNVAAFRQLIENPQVHLIAEATAVGDQILSDSFPRQRYQIGSLPALTSPLYLIASKRNPANRELILKFNKALATLNEEQRQAIESMVLTQLDKANQVLLNSFEPSGYLNGYLVSAGQPSLGQQIRLPKGTRAAVEQWPKAYLNATGDQLENNQIDWAKVKILNGPLREEILYVDSRAIELP